MTPTITGVLAAGPATRSHEETDRREAARALLAHPLLTAATHPAELAGVRRHAPWLKSAFASTLGYPLVVEPTFARLVKDVPTYPAPPRGAVRRSGDPFRARTYTFLALTCAALLTNTTGEQTLLSGLVAQVFAEAATADIAVSDDYADRRQLVAALEWLVDTGILEETDGTVYGWGERRDEALLTIHRNLLPHLLTRPLRFLPDVAALLADPAADSPTSEEQPRRTLRRKLVEQPVTWRADLTERELDVLSRERVTLANTLRDTFGLELEVRGEGALTWDPERTLTDVPFPATGTVAQASLLLIDALTAGRREQDSAGEVDPRGGMYVTATQVRDALRMLTEGYGRNWATPLRTDIDKLSADVVTNLTRLGLADTADGDMILLPAAARFRADVQLLPLRPPPDTPTPAPTLDDLFTAQEDQ